jgi:MraZ protein
VFHGAYNITLDAKGRIALPARPRAVLDTLCKGNFVVTRDLTMPCLLLFPLPHWQQLADDLSKLSNTNPNHQRIKRILLGFASDLECDSAGRVLLPQVLRDQAGLNKDVMMVGQGRTFQIWDQARWDEQIRADTELHGAGNDELPPLSY